jgi:methylmalonyl-CoA carboxyltransferase 5S subunit
MLEGTEYRTELDKARLIALKRYFNRVRPRYKEFLSNITGVETEIFDSQIPGGMISNMESQLRQQGAGDRLDEVLAEVPRVRKDAGYPPLVTPSSQILGTQAVFNVMMGRYKVLTGEFADLMLGYYGLTIGERDPQVVALAGAHSKKESIDVRPADLLKPDWQELRSAALGLKGCDGSDEDVLTYAMFPQVASKFFASRDKGPINLGKDPDAAVTPVTGGAADPGVGPVRTPIDYDVTFSGKIHKFKSLRRRRPRRAGTRPRSIGPEDPKPPCHQTRCRSGSNS